MNIESKKIIMASPSTPDPFRFGLPKIQGGDHWAGTTSVEPFAELLAEE